MTIQTIENIKELKAHISALIAIEPDLRLFMSKLAYLIYAIMLAALHK